MDKLLSHLPPSTLTYYKKPLRIVRGQMQFLWDADGRRFLDMIGGIVTVSVGHCHPLVNSAEEVPERKPPAIIQESERSSQGAN